jgi:hypothetical protein
MRLYSYKITRDFGFAPNPFHGILTLATCKPGIRKGAVAGDIVVGCGSASNGLVGRAIFVARVSGKCSFQQYWDDPRFEPKKPYFGGSVSRGYGDNIYHRAAGGEWLQERSHHSLEDGGINAANLIRDTSADHVLWSTEFVYYGHAAIPIPANLRNVAGDDLYPATRDYRNSFPAAMIDAVENWFVTLPRNRQGWPGAW